MEAKTFSDRKTATIAGIFFIVAAVTAVVGLLLYDPVLNDPNYVTSSAADHAPVLWGAFFEVLLTFSLIGTAITLCPVVKRENETIALGYVCGRLLEAVFVSVGIISLLTIVTLNQEFVSSGTSSDAASFLSASKALVALHDWTLLFGPGMVIGPNTLMLAYLVHKLHLVPRPITILGLVGGPLIFVSGLAALFGLWEQFSAVGGAFALPITAWEMSLAVYLIAKGFKAQDPAHV